MKRSVTLAPACLALALGGLATAGPAAAAMATVEAGPGVTYEVLELKRVPAKDIVELRFAITNQSDRDLELDRTGFGRIEGGEQFAGGVRLVDLPNAKAYYAGSAGGRCLCSALGPERKLPAGQRGEYWAWYGVPSANVSELAVFFPGVPPVLAVPLAR
jgi:hypothetical protein